MATLKTKKLDHEKMWAKMYDFLNKETTYAAAHYQDIVYYQTLEIKNKMDSIQDEEEQT